MVGGSHSSHGIPFQNCGKTFTMGKNKLSRVMSFEILLNHILS